MRSQFVALAFAGYHYSAKGPSVPSPAWPIVLTASLAHRLVNQHSGGHTTRKIYAPFSFFYAVPT